MPDADDGLVDAARADFAATLDAIEERLDPVRRWTDLTSRVRSRASEEPATVVAVAVAAVAVTAFAVFLVVRARGR